MSQKFPVRLSVQCTWAFDTSNFVTECLPKVGTFYENNMKPLDPYKSKLECVVHELIGMVTRTKRTKLFTAMK